MIALAGATPAHADTVRDLEYWLADYGFTTAWNTSRGEGVTVAVIDTGVNGNVAELRGAVTAARMSRASAAPTGRRRSATTRTTARWSRRSSPAAERATATA